MSKVTHLNDLLLDAQRTAGFKLVLFFMLQVVVFMLFIMSLNHLSVREAQVSSFRLQNQNNLIRGEIAKQFELVHTAADELALSASAQYPWSGSSTKTSNNTLMRLIIKQTPLIKAIYIFDNDGDLRVSSDPSAKVSIKDTAFFSKVSSMDGTTLHYGPFKEGVSSKYYFMRKLYAKTGTLLGVLVLSLDMPNMSKVCVNLLGADDYSAYVLSETGSVITGCSYGTVSKQTVIMPLTALPLDMEVASAQLESPVLVKINNPNYTMLLNTVAGYPKIKVLTALSKKGQTYNSMTSLEWQNDIYLVIGLLAQILCFMAYYYSLRRISLLKDLITQQTALDIPHTQTMPF
jgi:hypothetical protein